jgi:WD40 repeat protein
VTVRDADTGKVLLESVRSSPMKSVAISRDATTLVTDWVAWSVKDAHGTKLRPPRDTYGSALVAMPNGGAVRGTFADWTGALRGVFDLASGDPGVVIPDKGAVWSGDGAVLVGDGGSSRAVHVWRAPSLELLATVADARALFADEKGDAIVVSQKDETVVWDLRRGVARLVLPSAEGAAFGFDGATLAMANKDGASLWDVASGKKIASLAISTYGAPILGPDGRTVVVCATDHEGFVVYDASGGHSPFIHGSAGEWRRREGAPCLFTPDGRHLLVPVLDERIDVWDLATKQRVAVVRARADGAGAAVVSDDAVELLGDPLAASALLHCTIGHRVLPFEVCADRLLTPGLLGRLLGAPPQLKSDVSCRAPSCE